MNDNLSSIRGYRPLPERKEDRKLSFAYLHPDSVAAKLNNKLWHSALDEGAPCVGREDEFSGDTLPSDREAALMCSTCPLATFRLCGQWAEAEHLAYGVAGGRVWGRKLEEALKDD